MTRRALPVLSRADDALPGLQARWLDSILDGPLPDEVEATCGDCAMLGGDGLRFSTETRCCTFVPALSNFLVGGGLREGGAGRRSLLARVASGVGVSPLGLIPDPNDVARRVAPERFGQDPSAACPHYEPEAGRCGVWRWREATCATWYCKHTRGARSKAYWNRLHQLVARLERGVAWRCATSLEIPAAGLAAMTPLDRPGGAARADVVGESLDPEALWGPWLHRVEDYFLACVEVAEALTPEEVLRLAGPEALAMRAALGLGREGLSRGELPARVALGSVKLVGLEADAVRLQGYSHLDPLRVPRALFDQLHHFDGRDVGEALRAATEAAGEEVPAEAVAMLLEWDILRAAE